MPAKRLEGKVALITGACSGIGCATAHQFACEGAKLVLADKSDEKLDHCKKEFKSKGWEVTCVCTDVCKEADNKRMVDTAMDTYGRLDICFFNAGVGDKTPLCEVTEEVFDKVIGTNLKSVVFGLKYALPAIEKSGGNGSVVVNTSVNASHCKDTVHSAGYAVYSASKAGADMVMKYAAVEAAKHHTRVNSVAPGLMHSGVTGEMLEKGMEEECARAHLLGRCGKPEEMASVVCFLASDEASFVTGSCMQVDGGWSIKA